VGRLDPNGATSGPAGRLSAPGNGKRFRGRPYAEASRVTT
jgi:hypothetical protein